MKRSKFLFMVSFLIFVFVPTFFLLGLSGCQNTNSRETEISDTITILDGKSRVVELKLPIDNIVSLSSGITSLICAFGDGDKIIGRDSYSTFPSDVSSVEEVAKSSAAPNIELILEKKPDVVFADSQIHDEEISKLADCGIPVVTDVTSDPERMFFLIRNMGLILDKKEKAEEIISFMEGYIDTVHERIGNLDFKEEALPKIYFESHSEYKSASSQTSYHKTIVEAGGINIAASELSKLPLLSPEWIIEKNPDVIIRRVSGDENYDEMKALRDEIMSRPGFQDIAAVQNGKVYIIKSDVFMTLRYPIGLLYYALYFHPDIFGDMNPVKAHQTLINKFLGEKEWKNMTECFAFP
ncbi:MAG: ABC transporter substrate-binding protein [Actinomycetota bacterium]|nr:ABC transporter substrate-binding protein [Actinomycetota bacterium]